MMDLTNPWMLPDEVFAWLETNLNPDSTVLELGSGQGTQRLCAMYRHVYSVEHDAAYLYTAQADYIYAPLDGIEDARWYNPRSLEDKLPKDYSFLLIDGPPGPTRANVAAWFHLFRDDVPILYDDTDREADRMAAEAIASALNRPIEHIAAPSRGEGKMFSVIPLSPHIQ